MNVPKQPPGVYIRWLVLLGLLSYFLYFLITGIKSNPPSSNAVYICDTNNESELTQCQSLDDETSCANLVDGDGNVATCIQSSCGYKLFDMLDVSVAGTSDPYSSEDANDPTSFLSVMSIFYGIVPYLAGFIYIVWFLASGSIVPMTRLVVLGVIALINDEILKKIVVQERPMGSCLHFKSYGMPSGHSATSIGLLTYLLLEVFVLHPNLMCGLTCQKKGLGDGEDDVYHFAWGYGWQKIEDNNHIDAEQDDANDVGGYSAVTNNDSASGEEKRVDVEAGNNASTANEITSAQRSLHERWKYHLYAILYCLLFFPVPFSRVYLYDHYKNQVLFGAIEGILIASAWFGVMHLFGVRFMKWWSKSACAKWFGLAFE